MSINGHSAMPEKICHDHLDDLALAMQAFYELNNQVRESGWLSTAARSVLRRPPFGVPFVRVLFQAPGQWKADIDAAFRRVPIREAHKWAAGVAYVSEGQTHIAFHEGVSLLRIVHARVSCAGVCSGMPFGASSSVYAWHRVGALLSAAARHMLHLPVYRYVDDFFGIERPETAEHAMNVFARLVRLLLGQTAIAERKLEHGSVLVVLGMQARSLCYGPCSLIVCVCLCHR